MINRVVPVRTRYIKLFDKRKPTIENKPTPSQVAILIKKPIWYFNNLSFTGKSFSILLQIVLATKNPTGTATKNKIRLVNIIGSLLSKVYVKSSEIRKVTAKNDNTPKIKEKYTTLIDRKTDLAFKCSVLLRTTKIILVKII